MFTPVPPARASARSGPGLGRVAGIPVRADWGVVLVAVLLTLVVATVVVPSTAESLPGWAAGLIGAAGAAAFLGSILVHELSHALVARRSGLRVEAISLSLFGGLAHMVDDPRTPRQAWRVAAAGPAASLALAAAFGTTAVAVDALGGPGVAVRLAVWLAWANAVLGLFNLLPGLPLDGGRILQAWRWRRTGDRHRATLTAARAGRYVGLAVVAYGVVGLVAGGGGGLWSMIIGWLIMSSARAEALAAEARRSLGGLRMSDVMTAPVVTAPDYLGVATFDAEYVSVHGRSAYPIRSFSGRVVGLVSVPHLAALPAERRAEARLADLALPADRLAWAGPDELVVDVLARGAGLAAGGRILVGTPDDLLGIVTPADVERAVTRRALRGAPLPPPRPLPSPTLPPAPAEVAHR